VIGVVLALLYGALAPTVTGALVSGPPGYDYEVWLANALLSVTFPLLIYHAALLGYWPLAKPSYSTAASHVLSGATVSAVTAAWVKRARSMKAALLTELRGS
jgi:hypothetical protein